MKKMRAFIPVLLLLVIVLGCHQQQRIDTSTLSDEAKTEVVKFQTVVEKVYRTNWLATVFILSIFGGCIAAANGRLLQGLSVVASAIASLYALAAYQSFALSSWPILLAIGVFLAAIGVLVWSLFIRNRGFAIVRRKNEN